MLPSLALQDDAVFEALELGSFDAGGFSSELFEAALCRSHSISQARPGYVRDPVQINIGAR
jgi:hypothetical protein